MNSHQEQILELIGGLGFIKGYSGSALESAELFPDSYSRERLLGIIKSIHEKAIEAMDARENVVAGISRVSNG